MRLELVCIQSAERAVSGEVERERDRILDLDAFERQVADDTVELPDRAQV